MNNDRCTEDDIRAAVQYAVIQLCNEQDDQTNMSIRTSPRAIAAISELCYQYATRLMACDLEAFSQHAGRKTTINDQDVKLMVRRNPILLSRLNDALDELNSNNKISNNSIGRNDTKKRSKNAVITFQSSKKHHRRKSIIDKIQRRSSDTESSSESTDEELVFESCFANNNKAIVRPMTEKYGDVDSDFSDNGSFRKQKVFKLCHDDKENTYNINDGVLDDTDSDCDVKSSTKNITTNRGPNSEINKNRFKLNQRKEIEMNNNQSLLVDDNVDNISTIEIQHHGSRVEQIMNSILSQSTNEENEFR